MPKFWRALSFGLLLMPAVIYAGPASLRAKAVDLYTQGRFEEASAIYEKLSAAAPDDLGLAKDYMWTLWNAKHYNDAAAVAASIVAKHPKDLEAVNLMARADALTGEQDLSFDAYKKSLELRPDQPRVQRMLGNYSFDLRDFDQAIHYYQALEIAHPERHDIYPSLAKALFYAGRFSESVGEWQKVIPDNPTNLDYQYNYARALYFSGHVEQALDTLRSIAKDQNLYYWRAVDFLTDDELASGDTTTAQAILEHHLTELRPQDEPRYLKLANIYILQGQIDKAMALLDRLLNVDPKNGQVLLFKGDALLEFGRAKEAERNYRAALELNPYEQRAMLGIAETRFIQKDGKDAIHFADMARRQDPTDPLLVLTEARYLYENGQRRESHALTDAWLKNSTETSLSILLYHGLTPFKRDPMLAYSIHQTTATFDSQMQALKNAGYTPVTVPEINDWLHDKKPLPAHPVLIAFDDARMDSFIYGDPILEKYGFKATMFAALVNVEGFHPPAYASWEKMATYVKTGRWDIQSHGNYAHIHIPIDEEGHQGLFLVNREWLDKEHRLETPEEWRSRIIEDHELSKQKIEQNIGAAPVGYAFPEGAYGQTDSSNDTDATPLNLELSRKEFALGFIQDNYGQNLKSRDPIRLKRLEPGQTWSGDALIEYIREHDPITLMEIMRLRQAAWDGHYNEAYAWYHKLELRDLPKPVLGGEKAYIQLGVGDIEGAHQLATAAYAVNPTSDTYHLLESIHHEALATWNPTFIYENDNQGRTHYFQDQILETEPHNHTRLSLRQHYDDLSENGFAHEQDSGAGLGLSHLFGNFQTAAVEADAHALKHGTNTYSLIGSLHSYWTDIFTTDIDGGQSLYDTAAAVDNNVLQHYGRLRMNLLTDNWHADAIGEWVSLTDTNKRTEAEAEIARRIFPSVERLNIVYKFTYDNMHFISPYYYSPQHLVQHQGGLELLTNSQKPLSITLRYLPGYGSEGAASSEFVQDVEVTIPWHITKNTTLTARGAYTRTPSYRRDTAGLDFNYRF